MKKNEIGIAVKVKNYGMVNVRFTKSAGEVEKVAKALYNVPLFVRSVCVYNPQGEALFYQNKDKKPAKVQA